MTQEISNGDIAKRIQPANVSTLKMPNTKTAVILTGDQHIGSTVGLCPPRVSLDDGGTYRASPGQRWLWDRWVSAWEQIEALTAGYRRVAVFNGDLVDFDVKRRGSPQYITSNEADILRLASTIVDPVAQIADRLIFVRGTSAHTGASAVYEEIVARDFDNAATSGDNASWWHVRGEFAGVRMDIAHHTSAGRLPWTGPNAANKLAAVTMMQYALNGWPAPALVFRSHIHKHYDSYDNYPVRAVTLPAWQLATEYAYRIGAENSLADVGALVILCDGGDYELRKFISQPKQGRVWVKM